MCSPMVPISADCCWGWVLTGLVVLGGLARALAAFRLGAWSLPVTLSLGMELGVTPALWLWQRRVARKS
jgi:hypothetical protein